MITLFAIPKPFEGHNGIIQKNAMTSWSKIIGNPEIIVYGEGEGISEACKHFNFIHVPEVEVNEYGTPLVDFIFNDAKKRAKNDTVCYINSDIILLFLKTVIFLNFHKHLLPVAELRGKLIIYKLIQIVWNSISISTH